jgi:hypothetical protein
LGPKKNEIIRGSRELHNEELHNLWSLPDKIRMVKSRMVRLTGIVAHLGEKRNACRVLVGNPKGLRPLGRPACRWEDIR